jgi:sterol 3beta-glucosyltransferase
MKTALIVYGTRGDTQPFVCLGRALADRGHPVELIATRDGEALARAANLPFRPLPMDSQALMRAEPAQRMLADGRIGAFFRWLSAEERANADEMRQALIAAGKEADLIVCGALLSYRCGAIADAHGIAVASLHLTPTLPSREYTSSMLPQRRLGPLTRPAHLLPLWTFYRTQLPDLRALHDELDLPAPRWSSFRQSFTGKDPCLLAYSEALFPRPSDWPSTAHPAGFFAPWPELRRQIGEVGVPAEPQQWIGAGDPPVFFGFGSMPVLDREAMLATIRGVLAGLGRRGIVAAGWSDLTGAGDDSLFIVDQVDHQSVLPRCAAVVHHGGAGTTAASAAAGVPTLVCSIFADQPFWGARCRALGIGDTFPFAKLDSQRLSAGLRTVLKARVVRRAKEVGRRMAEEDGVGGAVEYLEREFLSRDAEPEISPRAGLAA